MIRTLALLGSLALVSACSTSGVAIPLGKTTYPPTSPADVEVLVTLPNRPYVEVALVDGTAATDDYFTQERTQAAALKVMKEKAAQHGANAIVMDEDAFKNIRPYGGVWEKIQLRGKAIRYTTSQR